MSKKQKLYQKILSGSKNIRFGDLITLLIAFGFELDRTRGSHQIYKHPQVIEVLSLQESKNGQAKPYQIEQFLELVEKYDLNMNDDSEVDSEE